MNESEPIEHILLASEDDPGAEPQTIHGEFRQVSEYKGYYARYEIFNEHYLQIRLDRSHTKSRRHVVDLTFLDPEPMRLRTIDWSLLWLALGLTAMTALLAAYVYYTSSSALQNPWLPVTIGTGTAAAVVGLLALYRSSDKLLFYSQHGRIPLLELLNRKAQTSEIRAFVHDVQRRIHHARAEHYPSTRTLLAAELREHRRLKDEAVIGEVEYEAARTRILQCHVDP